MKRLLRPAAALLLVAASGLLAFGQGGSTGSLAGTVADQKGDVVAGASVVVRSEATGAEVATTTADNGTFNVPALPSGRYTVTVTVSGFKKAVMQNVKVDVGQPSSVTVVLEVGETHETVTVVGEGGELLQTQSHTVGTTITGRQITELPFTSRDALDLVTLLPGTNTVGRPRQSSVNGLPKGALTITIDGTDAQDNLLKSSDGFFTYIRPRIDAIEEVTISTATPGAESSGDGAVVIKFVTRGGTNDYRGSLYWYHRNPWLNANYWYNNTLLPEDPVDKKAPRTRILLNQYGGRFGGPITIPGLFDGRDRAFFFVNYEEYRLPERFSRTRTVFQPHILTGEYRYISGGTVRSVNLFQIAQAAGLPNTADPTVLGLLNQINSATSKGGLQPITNDPNRQNLTFINPGGQDRYFPTVRFDFDVTKKHHLENIWNYQVFNNGVDFLNTADPAFPEFPNVGGQDSNRWSNTTALRSTLTPTIVNEARFGLTGGNSLFRALMSPEMFSNQGGFALGISAGGVSNGFNAAHNSAQRRNSPTQEFSDTVTWVRDEHTFTFGGSWKRINLYQQANNQLVPTIAFGVDATDAAGQAAFNNNTAAFPGATAAQRTTAAAIYAVLTGRVTSVGRNAYMSEDDQSYTLLGDLTRRARQEEFGLFVQDSWRVRPSLTLNYGLRWQPQGAFTVMNSTWSVPAAFEDVYGVSGPGNLFSPGTLTGRVPTFVAAPEGYQPYKADRKNFAPSLGFAWSPDWKSGALRRLFGSGGQSVIRGGYSIAFVREGTQTFLSVTGANPGGSISATRSIALGTLPVGTLLRNPAGLAPPAIPTTAAYPLAAASTDGVNVFHPDLKTGYVQSWTFGFQRELTKNMVVEARYVANRGTDLWRQYDLNEINVIENGFTEEFRRAQQNLIANNASGVAARRNSFAYFGPGSGTQPLPVLLGFFRGPGAAGSFNPNNQALYTSTLFTNAALVNNLSPIAPNVLGFASNVFGNAGRRANAIGVGIPANYFVVNPTTLGGGSSTSTSGHTISTGGAFIVDNSGKSWYDAMVLEFRRRMARGLLVQASYTWSKAQTNIFDVSSSVFSQFPTIRDESLAKTASSFDTRHAFKLNWIAELPFGRGKMFLGDSGSLVNYLAGGWEIHGTARIQSGAAFNLGNVQLVGMTREELQKAVGVRKAANGIVTYLPDDIINNTIAAFNVDPTNATGFSAQFGVPTGRFIAPASFGGCIQQFVGQCGASNLILYGPRFVKIDASIVKKFHFTERVNFEMRGEFLNALNNVPFRVGGWAADTVTISNFGATTFGQLGNGSAYQDTSTTNDPGGRLVQIVLRLNF